MKIRSAGGLGKTLDEAMDGVVEVHSKGELMDYLRKHFYFRDPTEENVTIEPYCYDKRISWDTYLICIDRKAALFSDGPLP